MAYLHNGNQNPTTVFSFYPCISDSVYLEGLKEGESIQSKEPYFFQNANGYLAIDDRFTSFTISRNGETIQSISLRWNKTCTSQTETQAIIKPEQTPMNPGFSSMMVLSAGILAIVAARRFFHAHK
jgi:hypothetical protein